MKSVILGLNINHADSSSCLLIDGEIVAAAEEERFNRIKHWSGFPIKSIDFCLNEAGLKFENITDVTINTNPLSNLNYKIFSFLRNYIFGSKKFEIFKRLQKKINLKKKLLDTYGKNCKFKLHYIDHHLSHISSAFYPSGFENSLGLSIDGFGDFTSIAIADCTQRKIKIIKKILFPNSLGVFYEAATQLAGFLKYGDEYKLMGLSAYGKPKYYELIKKNLFIDYDKNLELNLKHYNFQKKNFSYMFEGEPNQNIIFDKSVKELFKEFNNFSLDEINVEFKRDLASSTQKIFEEKLFRIIKDNKKNYENLSYAGGCALNSLANGKIVKENIFKNMFVPFCPGDNGGSIGSALYLYKKKYPDFKTKNLCNPYLGKCYSKEEISSSLSKYRNLISFKFIQNFDELIKFTAKSLKDNKIVGWFQDKMEFGPRALGNRSIISSPIGPEIKNLINSKVKIRESFRPFAPAVLDEKVSDWFEQYKDSQFMSFVLPIKESKRKIIPSVTHIDGTGRLQTVKEQSNRKFYKLILEFENITNVPILLNTSFNENEPIVMTPQDAIECFLRTEIDYLVIDNYLVSKI